MEKVLVQVMKTHFKNVIYVDDSDFERYFKFNETLDYFDDVYDFLNVEYCTNIQTENYFYKNIEYPIVLDFTNKKFYILDDDCSLSKKDVFIYYSKVLKKSIYSTQFILTNSKYSKKLLFMLFIKLKNTEFVNIMLYNFMHYISYIIRPYCTYLSNIDKNTTISLPFNKNFTETLYSVEYQITDV